MIDWPLTLMQSAGYGLIVYAAGWAVCTVMLARDRHKPPPIWFAAIVAIPWPVWLALYVADRWIHRGRP